MSFLKKKKRRKNRFKIVNKVEEEKEPERNTKESKQGKLMGGEVEVTIHEMNSALNQKILLSQEEFSNVSGDMMIEMTYTTLENKEEVFCFKFKSEFLSDFMDGREAKMSLDVGFCTENNLQISDFKGKKVHWRSMGISEQHKNKVAVVEIGFKNQYVSLRDLKEISKELSHQFVYMKEEIDVNGFDIKIMGLKDLDSSDLRFGLICPEFSKMNFYSLSSKVLITVQICQETFEFSNTRDLTYSR